VAHQRHLLDDELAEPEKGRAQPRRHEHADEEDEGDGGGKPETCTIEMKMVVVNFRETENFLRLNHTRTCRSNLHIYIPKPFIPT
jgi:hypothetical protein